MKKKIGFLVATTLAVGLSVIGVSAFGNDKLNENEDIRTHHINYGCHEYHIEDTGISRERIKKSVEKLRSMGVEFEYNEPPVVNQYVEDEKEVLK